MQHHVATAMLIVLGLVMLGSNTGRPVLFNFTLSTCIASNCPGGIAPGARPAGGIIRFAGEIVGVYTDALWGKSNVCLLRDENSFD